MRKVVFVQGGGIGLDQEASVRRLFEAAGVPIDFDVHVAGRAALEQARDALPKDTFDAVQACGLALKTKLLQPKGAGTPTAHGPTVPTNYNVAFRRGLGFLPRFGRFTTYRASQAASRASIFCWCARLPKTSTQPANTRSFRGLCRA